MTRRGLHALLRTRIIDMRLALWYNNKMVKTTIDADIASPGWVTSELKEHYAANKSEYDATFGKLDRLFGADRLDKIDANSFMEYEFRKYQFGNFAANNQDLENLDWGSLYKLRIVNILETTRAIHSAVNILDEQYGIDILHNRKAISNLSVEDFTAVDQDMKLLSEEDGGARSIGTETLGYVIARDLLSLYGRNKATFAQGIENINGPDVVHPHPAIALAVKSQTAYYKRVIDDMSAVRYDTHRELRVLHSPDVLEFINFVEKAFTDAKDSADSNEIIDTILESQKQELNYTIFPAGTELKAIAEDIVEGSSEYTRASVDLRRLSVLEEVRQLVGPENCYLMRGQETGKEMDDGNGRLISEDYIGLIIQHHDADGTVTAEDCLAISPIAKKHAGYIVRQEASAGISWREVLSLPKQDAIDYFNARRLRFDPVTGEDKYEAYVKKVVTLLTCEPEKFTPDYRLRRKGEDYDLVYRARSVGTVTLNAAALSELLDSSADTPDR